MSVSKSYLSGGFLDLGDQEEIIKEKDMDVNGLRGFWKEKLND